MATAGLAMTVAASVLVSGTIYLIGSFTGLY